MEDVVILIPAAGASSRMLGSDKLLERVDGQALLRMVAEQALSVSNSVLVTLPAIEGPRHKVLDGMGVALIPVPDAKDGMSASLRAAAPHLANSAAGVMVRPADMPDLTTADLRHLMAAFHDGSNHSIIQGTGTDGTPGHPVIFPNDLAKGFSALSGDTGARAILAANQHRLKRVSLPKQNALTDLDTPEAWASWRQKNQDR